MDITQKRINVATRVIIDIYKYTSLVEGMKQKFIRDDIDMWRNRDTDITEGDYLIMTNDLKEKSKMCDVLNTFMKQTIHFISTLFEEKGFDDETIKIKLKAIINLARHAYNKDTDELIKMDDKEFINVIIIEKYLNECLENIRTVKTY